MPRRFGSRVILALGMYQPAHRRFTVDDPKALLAELCTIFPATLVTHDSDGFQTSILPMLFYPAEGETGLGILRGHLARANPQWRLFAGAGAGSAAIAIFNAADAYVSPAWYEEKRLTGKVVPTWNYTTAVVTGTIVAHPEQEWLLPHIRALVERHESGRNKPWSVDDAPPGYVETHARAIVGLEMTISAIDAKRKLSQNRSAADIRGVIEGLLDGTSAEREVAIAMQHLAAPEDGA